MSGSKVHTLFGLHRGLKVPTMSTKGRNFFPQNEKRLYNQATILQRRSSDNVERWLHGARKVSQRQSSKIIATDSMLAKGYQSSVPSIATSSQEDFVSKVQLDGDVTRERYNDTTTSKRTESTEKMLREKSSATTGTARNTEKPLPSVSTVDTSLYPMTSDAWTPGPRTVTV